MSSRWFQYEGSPLSYAGCQFCGEYWSEALRQKLRHGRPVCMNCADTYHTRGVCTICVKEDVPIQDNHVAGRRYDDTLITVCLNCHAILSESQRKRAHLVDGAVAAMALGLLDIIGLMVLRGRFVVPHAIIDLARQTAPNVLADLAL